MQFNFLVMAMATLVFTGCEKEASAVVAPHESPSHERPSHGGLLKFFRIY